MTKHNKIRNTAIMFEVLTRAVVHETMHETAKPVAINIIKRHFKQGSLLLKELQMYQALSGKTEHSADELFELTLRERGKIDESALSQEKYDLVKSIKKHYDIKQLTETRISNYKLNATIYKLFEGASNGPSDYLDCKRVIFEQLTGTKQLTDPMDEHIESELRGLDKVERGLALKFIVERFNEKYRSLNTKQKSLLSMYINEDSTSDKFKDYVMGEVKYITAQLNRLMDSQSGVERIKIAETLKLTENIITSKHIKDEHLSAMLKYYELIEELKV